MITTATPQILSDARYHCGRKLVTMGKAGEGAIEIFANLLDQVRKSYGDDDIECAGPYYEYGNAIFRSYLSGLNNSEEEDARDRKRMAAAEAAEKRLLATTKGADNELGRKSKSEEVVQENVDERDISVTEEASDENEDNVDPDLALSLEMMENAWSIVDQYLASSHLKELKFKEWAKEQYPRLLTGIGEVLSEMGRHADAADVFSRAVQERQDQWQQNFATSTDTPTTLGALVCRRRIAETFVLIAEEFLSCPPDSDVITSETKSVLCKANERVEYARGYYEKARDELQETVLLMGQLVAAGVAQAQNWEEEKENVCFASTLVMAVGTRLAEIDEEEQEKAYNATEPTKKKSRHK